MKPIDKTWMIESKKHFFKYWFNKRPDLVILQGLCIVMGIGAYLRVSHKEATEPFVYRYQYTVWRDDDPRAIKMMDRMHDFKPLRRID